MPGIGLEPIRLAAPAPEAGASTNFATRAYRANRRFVTEVAIIYEREKKLPNLKKTPRPKIVKEKRSAAKKTKSTQGRVKNYVVTELVQKAVEILSQSATDLDTSELYVLLSQHYRKLNESLFALVLDRLMGDSRVRFDSQRKCFTHKAKKEHTGIVVTPAQNFPYVIEDDTGERFSLTQDAAKLYLPGDAVRFRAGHSSEPWDDVYLFANVTEVIDHAVAEIVGEVKKNKSKNGKVTYHFKKFDPRLCNLSVKFTEPDSVLEAWVDQKAVAAIERYPSKDDPRVYVRIDRVLEVNNDADLEIELAVRQFNLPYEFSPGTMQEAEKLPEKVLAKDRARRVDLRDVPFCTIDGEDARDFDDAVYAEPLKDGAFRLLVAIADVSYYVKPGSDIDHDAQMRSTSVYFPRRVIPMLPEKLCNGLCSLNPNVDRLTMVCDMVIDSLGMVKAYQFYPGVIHSHARLTYTNAWKYLSGEAVEETDVPATVRGSLDNLYALYKVLRQARKTRGAIDFATRETLVKTDEKGDIVAIVARESNDAHRLIEECMLAANTCAADFIGRHKKLSLYRVHDSPSVDKLLELRRTLSGFGLSLSGGNKPTAADYEAVVEAVSDKPYSDVIQTALLRSMQRAVYSPDNIGHYGLGYEAYTHFTSPIRRYPDLLVHRTIRGILSRRTYRPTVYAASCSVLNSLSGMTLKRTLLAMPQPEKEQATDPSRGAWVELGKITSACERRADDASRDVTAWLKCRYMKSIASDKQKFTATITAVTSYGLYVQLQDIFVDGFVHISNIGFDYYGYTIEGKLVGETFGEEFAVGDVVTVSLIDVDEDRRRIDFRISRSRR